MPDYTQPAIALADPTNFDNLIAGIDPQPFSESGTLLSGENCVRGTVMGKVTAGTPTGAAVAGNTGNGTLTGISNGAGAKVGVYRLTCIEPATNLGKFTVEGPTGLPLGVATVGTGFTGEINFTINDGATDFVSGDAFTITVAAGSGKWRKAVAASTDGSDVPLGILAGDMDASAADKTVAVYRRGVFNQTMLTFGAGVTIANSKEALLGRSILLVAPGVDVV